MGQQPSDLIQHYADYYDGASEWRYLGAEEKANSVALLTNDMSFNEVIEVGCGEGSVVAHLARMGLAKSFVCLEVSPSAIAAAESRQYDAPVSFSLFDGEAIPAADGTYDLGILSHVVEHVSNPRGLITETARVARYVLIEVPLELHLRTPRYQWDDLGHINVYNRRSIRHLIASCGLRVQRERLYSGPRAGYTFHGQRGATARWAIKALARRVGGPALFTYNFAALATRPRDK